MIYNNGWMVIFEELQQLIRAVRCYQRIIILFC